MGEDEGCGLESSFGSKERSQPKQRASYCVIAQRRQEDGNNTVFLRHSTSTRPSPIHPTPHSASGSFTLGGKSPSGQSPDQSCSVFSGPPKMQGKKGQRSGKTFGKAKVIPLLDHRTPLHDKHKVSDPPPIRSLGSFA